MITIDPEHPKIIGSLSYRIQKYPSDIDTYEDVHGINKQDVLDQFIKGIIKIVRNYLDKKDRWFIELKAGKDKRYDIDLDKMNVTQFLELLDTYYVNIMEQSDINNLKDSLKQYTGNIHICEKELIYIVFRKYYIIRWSGEDILKGYKDIYDERFYLTDVIYQSGDVNIECISIIDGIFQDISNYFVLTYTDKSGTYAYNLSQNTIDNFKDYFISNIMKSIYTLVTSCIYDETDYFKASKRIWSLCRYIYNNVNKTNHYYKFYAETINKLKPLMSSNASNLYQIKSRLTTIVRLLQHYNSIYIMNSIKKEVIQLKSELIRISILNEKMINNIIKVLDNLTYEKNYIIESFNYLIFILDEIVRNNTLEYLIEVGILYKHKNGHISIDDLYTSYINNEQAYITLIS